MTGDRGLHTSLLKRNKICGVVAFYKFQMGKFFDLSLLAERVADVQCPKEPHGCERALLLWQRLEWKTHPHLISQLG